MLCQGLTRAQANELYLEVLESKDEKALRRLCQQDLFFLLTAACKRKDIDRDWLYERCREVEAKPNGQLDLWAREHYKSTIITFGLSIKDILNNPSITIGIFSHTRPIAKQFLNQIKTELQQNTFLKDLFPDVLYQNPEKESPKWSLEGLRVKRPTNPKEDTIEAWGVVDGQPTSKHFDLLVYDDLVTLESVSSPEQIQKTTDALATSYNLGAIGGHRRFIGTRYHQNDTYKTVIDRGTVTPRIITATKDGEWPGEAVFMPQQVLEEKRRDMGPYIFAAQMLQNPTADRAMGFKTEWLRYYKGQIDYSKWNVYVLVDPASAKKKSSDYTVMEVIGLAPDNNYYLIDAVRDRMNLTERTNKLFEFHRLYNPKAVGYEKYGKDSDIEHIEFVMQQENYRFKITELGGSTAKVDRIKKLIPVYEQSRFYSPEKLMFVDYEGRTVDYVKTFNENEYSAFPVCLHDDMLDCRARILDPVLGAKFPKAVERKKPQREFYSGGKNSWMG